MPTTTLIVPMFDGHQLTDRVRRRAEMEAARMGGALGEYRGIGPEDAPSFQQGHVFDVHLPDPEPEPAKPSNQVEFTCPGCGKVSHIVFVPAPPADRTITFPQDGDR